jgi:hypothetical protein
MAEYEQTRSYDDIEAFKELLRDLPIKLHMQGLIDNTSDSTVLP